MREIANLWDEAEASYRKAERELEEKIDDLVMRTQRQRYHLEDEMDDIRKKYATQS